MSREVDELVLNLGLCLEHSGADITKKLQALSLLTVAFSQRAADGETEAVREARHALGNASARFVAAGLGVFIWGGDLAQSNNKRGES